MPKEPVYEAVIRPNGRGGFEIGHPDLPVGMGIGSYGAAADAYAVACYNHEPARIQIIEEAPAPAPKPKRAVTFRAAPLQGGAR